LKKTVFWKTNSEIRKVNYEFWNIISGRGILAYEIGFSEDKIQNV